jgi:5-(hydroxymethyl)furfural/furfural oxidase
MTLTIRSGNDAPLIYDHVIVGAGAAGSVLAARLTEDPSHTVMLVEAGEDVEPGREPKDVRNIFPISMFNARFLWPDTFVHWRRASDSPAMPMMQGRIVGGTSAIMGMWAMRGRPEDYDEWERDGASGWGWNGVLPFFRKLESDQDFHGPDHGTSGPIPIRRTPQSEWSPTAQRVHQAVTRKGWPLIDDMNTDFRDGETVVPISRYADSRASAGICYLSAEVRKRPNLTVTANIHVQRVLFDGKRATGVTGTRQDGSQFEARGHEIILTAGALRSPELLLRSGVGPAEELRAADITVVADRAGVGRRLQNHPMVVILAFLKRDALEARGWRPAGTNYLRWSTGMPGAQQSDMAMYIRSYMTWHALGRRLAGLSPSLARPFSSGRVYLDASSPRRNLKVEFNFFDDQRDLTRMMDGVRFAVELFESREVAGICGPPVILTNPGAIMRYNRLSRMNALRGLLAAAALDIAPARTERMLRKVSGMRSARAIADDETELADYLRRSVIGSGHPTGTCRMGRESDPQAVTAADGCVYGVEGLRVADASIMPYVPSCNTHIPVVMAAEKIADTLRQRRTA